MIFLATLEKPYERDVPNLTPVLYFHHANTKLSLWNVDAKPAVVVGRRGRLTAMGRARVRDCPVTL